MDPHDKRQADAANPEQRLRDGDTGVGIPPSEGIEGARRLTDSDVAVHEQQQHEQQRQRVREHLREFEANGALKLPTVVTRFALVVGLLVASVLGLLVVTQIASLATDIQMMPAPWNWALGTLGAFCALVLLGITFRLVLAILRLRRSPGVNIEAMEALQERHAWQRLAVEHAQQAEEKLRDYLGSYKLDAEGKKALLAAGLTEEEFEDLDKAKQRLLDDGQFLPPGDWLKDFLSRFQSVLDGAGQRCARSYGTRVAFGTAVSPIAVVDQAIVFYTSMRLVRNLVVLYNVRPGFGQTATIFARAVVQTYLGGEIERIAEEGMEAAITEMAGSSEDLLGSGAASFAWGPTAKFAEGATNGVLIWRLGSRAQSFLQPVRPPS